VATPRRAGPGAPRPGRDRPRPRAWCGARWSRTWTSTSAASTTG
jgi:hypothetical protein